MLPYDSIPEAPLTRRCSKCQEIKPLDEFTRNRSKRLGFSQCCKSCSRVADAARRQFPRFTGPILVEVKRCTKCGETKPADAFRLDHASKDGLDTHCKICARYSERERPRNSPLGTPHRCSYCQEPKPCTEFAKESTLKSGLKARCKECEKTIAANRPSSPKPWVPDGYKHCKKCGKDKAFESFYPDRSKNCRTGLASYCKECDRILSQEFRRTHPPKKRIRVRNPEAQRRAGKKYGQTHKEKLRAKWKARAIKNHDRILEQVRARRAKNREHWNEVVRKWRATEKGQLSTRETLHKRRQASGVLTQEDIERQYQAQKGICYYCRKQLRRKYDVEHVVPIARGGSNDPSNIVIACESCNARKHDKMPHEWPEGGRLC